MKKRKVLILFSGLIFGFIFLILNQNISAQTVKGFGIEPIYTKNQISKNGLLYQKTNPGQRQELSFNIVNFSNKSQKVKISANTAATSSSPSIYYSDNKFSNDQNSNLNFKNLFKKQTIVKKIKPNTPTKITFNANIPDNGFSGVISGGFYIDNNLTTRSNQNGTNINNHYTYVMPAILRGDNKIAKPNLTLGNVDAKSINDSPSIDSTIYNKKSASVFNADIDTKVTRDNQIIAQNKVGSGSIAPNTHFTMNTLSNQDKLSPGKYHIKIKINSDNGKWVLEKDFNVSLTQYVGSQLKSNIWWILIVILIIILIIALIVYIIYERRKKQHESKQ